MHFLDDIENDKRLNSKQQKITVLSRSCDFNNRPSHMMKVTCTCQHKTFFVLNVMVDAQYIHYKWIKYNMSRKILFKGKNVS